MSWSMYIVQCADGTLYTGSTNDVEARVRKHNSGRGAKYTRSRLPVRLVYQEVCGDRSAAGVREAEMKKLSRSEKQAIVLAASQEPNVNANAWTPESNSSVTVERA